MKNFKEMMSLYNKITILNKMIDMVCTVTCIIQLIKIIRIAILVPSSAVVEISKNYFCGLVGTLALIGIYFGITSMTGSKKI